MCAVLRLCVTLCVWCGICQVEAAAVRREEELKSEEERHESSLKDIEILKESLFKQSSELFRCVPVCVCVYVCACFG